MYIFKMWKEIFFGNNELFLILLLLIGFGLLNVVVGKICVFLYWRIILFCFNKNLIMFVLFFCKYCLVK